MRYIFLGLIIVAAGLAVYLCYDYYVNLPRVEFKVAGVDGKYTAGSNLKYSLNIVNFSRMEKCFVLGSRVKFKNKSVNFPVKYFVLRNGETVTEDYSSYLSEDLPPGNCSVEAELKDKAVNSEKTLERRILPFVLKQKPVEHKIITLNGTVKFVNLPQEIGFDGNIAIKALIGNTAQRDGKFNVRITIGPLNPGGNIVYEPETFERAVDLNAGAQKTVRVEYELGSNNPDGVYNIKAQLFNGETGELLSGVEDVVFVADNPPKLEFDNAPLFVRRGEQVEYRVRATDDRGVRAVTYYWRDLKENLTTNYMMLLSSGSVTDGIWSYSMGSRKKRNNFKFYITAVDAKSQETKTDEYAVTVVK